NDGDEVHALGFRQPGLGFDHLLEGAIASFGWKEQVRAACLRSLGVGGERAADEFDLLIHGGRDAMHGADERAAPAADHAVTGFSAHNVCRWMPSRCVFTISAKV